MSLRLSSFTGMAQSMLCQYRSLLLALSLSVYVIRTQFVQLRLSLTLLIPKGNHDYYIDSLY